MIRPLILVLVLSLSAAGARADSLSDCNQFKDIDQRIRACTRFIEREQSDQLEKRSRACENRAHAYLAKGDYKRAVADFTRGIALNPKNVQAYAGRARAYFLKFDLDSAIADSNRAIAIAPKYDPAYIDWSILYTVEGDKQ